MTDLEIFLKHCFVVSKTAGGVEYGVFMRHNDVTDGLDVFYSTNICRVLETVPVDEYEKEDPEMREFQVFGDECAGTKKQAKECLAALRKAILETVSSLKSGEISFKDDDEELE